MKKFAEGGIRGYVNNSVLWQNIFDIYLGDVTFDCSRMFILPNEDKLKKMSISDFDLYSAICKCYADTIAEFYQNRHIVVVESNRVLRNFNIKLISNVEHNRGFLFEYNRNLPILEYLLTDLNRRFELINEPLDRWKEKESLSFLEGIILKREFRDANDNKIWAKEWKYVYGNDIRKFLANILLKEKCISDGRYYAYQI